MATSNVPRGMDHGIDSVPRVWQKGAAALRTNLPHCSGGRATLSVGTRSVTVRPQGRCARACLTDREHLEWESVMKIAVAGKGGAGKTTLAGTLARVLGRRGQAVVAIDADTNP